MITNHNNYNTHKINFWSSLSIAEINVNVCSRVWHCFIPISITVYYMPYNAPFWCIACCNSACICDQIKVHTLWHGHPPTTCTSYTHTHTHAQHTYNTQWKKCDFAWSWLSAWHDKFEVHEQLNNFCYHKPCVKTRRLQPQKSTKSKKPQINTQSIQHSTLHTFYELKNGTFLASRQELPLAIRCH